MTWRSNLRAWVVISIVLMAFISPAAGRIIYVDYDGSADFNNIQAAIDDSNDGDTIVVADGIYTGAGNKNLDFGGRAITVRSETGPANCIIDCENDGRGFYFHSGEDANSVLGSFTITKGRADRYGGGIYCYLSSPTITNCNISGNSANRYGGGVCCRNNSSPTITNCTIRDNRSSDRCGGVYGSGGPISNCTITGNSSVMTPGGLYKCTGLISNCTFSGNTDAALVECSAISNCTISNNPGDGLILCGLVNNCIISGNSGWGLALCGSVRNCTISGNTKGGLSGCSSVSNCAIIGNTGYEGGGLLRCASITNCAIIGNTAEFGGGAARCDLISNCTFSNNRANGDGGGIYCYGNDTIVINCIFWGDTAPQGDEIALFVYWICSSAGCTFYPSSITISYSNVQGGPSEVHVDPNCSLVWGLGNKDTYPCFVDANNGDYHLKSQAGRWDANSESWIKDDVTSPCIDAANPGCPVGDEPEPNGNRRNMGAHGGTSEASKSPTYWRSIADITNDWIVDSNDLKVFADYWLQTGDCISGDFDRSLFVDFNDFAILGGRWQEKGPGPGITYEIGGCIPVDFPLSAAAESEPTRFTVTVDGRYIYFEDMMRANCCPEELEVQMTMEADLITIYEIEHTPMPCPCLCDFPITAKFGPFEPGIYILEVYQDGYLIGATIVDIENG